MENDCLQLQMSLIRDELETIDSSKGIKYGNIISLNVVSTVSKILNFFETAYAEATGP
jgi:hypothetical protein